MAKIVVEFDSVTKTGSVTIDGKLVEDLARFEMYRNHYREEFSEEVGDEGKKFYIELQTVKEDEASKMFVWNRITASEKGTPVSEDATLRNNPALDKQFLQWLGEK